MTETSFLENYNPKEYPAFAVTSDIILMTIRRGKLCVLLVERAGHPYQGHWALPGGFVNADEDTETAAMREMQEETGINLDFGNRMNNAGTRPSVPMSGEGVLQVEAEHAEELLAASYPAVFRVFDRDIAGTRGVLEAKGYKVLLNPSEEQLAQSRSLQQVSLFDEHTEIPGDYQPITVDTTVHLEQLKTYSAPNRDPRMRVVSTAYIALLPFRELDTPKAGSDARRTQWFAVHDLLNPRDPEDAVALAFDHKVILHDALNRVQSKLEYTPLATAFMDDAFTLADLRRIYEEVWNSPLHPANFRRKMLSVQDLLDEVGTKGESVFDGGRNAKLYRRGTAELMHPPYMMREATIDYAESLKNE